MTLFEFLQLCIMGIGTACTIYNQFGIRVIKRATDGLTDRLVAKTAEASFGEGVTAGKADAEKEKP